MSVLDVVCLDESVKELKVPGASDVYSFPRPIRTSVGMLESTLTDSGGAVTAFTFNTSSELANADSKLASWSNNGAEIAHIDKDGWFTGGPFLRLNFGLDLLAIATDVLFVGAAAFGAGELQLAYDFGTSTATLRSGGGLSSSITVGGAVHSWDFGQHALGTVTISGDHSATGATGSSQHGGPLVLQGGNAAVNGAGGNVTIKGGVKAGGGVAGKVLIMDLPTSASGLATGTLWNNGGTPAIA